MFSLYVCVVQTHAHGDVSICLFMNTVVRVGHQRFPSITLPYSFEAGSLMECGIPSLHWAGSQQVPDIPLFLILYCGCRHAQEVSMHGLVNGCRNLDSSPQAYMGDVM